MTISTPLLLAVKDVIKMCVIYALTLNRVKKVLFKAVNRQVGLALYHFKSQEHLFLHLSQVVQ